jgi:hypothetical protein
MILRGLHKPGSGPDRKESGDEPVRIAAQAVSVAEGNPRTLSTEGDSYAPTVWLEQDAAGVFEMAREFSA